MNFMRLMRRFRLFLASKGVYVYVRAPYGIDLKVSIERHGGRICRVFDVGANVGQLVYRFKAWWPEAEVYCFEPISTTFQDLVRNTRALRNVRCYRLALGARKGREEVWLQAKNVGNSLKGEVNLPEKSTGRSEMVEVTTLDEFCSLNGISDIDLLKLDVEGYELEVLKGGYDMLASGMIKFIIAETTLAGYNPLHVPIWELIKFLEPLSFRCVGVYNQRFVNHRAGVWDIGYFNYGDALFMLQE